MKYVTVHVYATQACHRHESEMTTQSGFLYRHQHISTNLERLWSFNDTEF